MALYVFRGRLMPPPNQKHRAELMNLALPDSPIMQGLIVQKQLLKLVHINVVMFKLIEAVPVVAQTNR